MSNEKKLAPGRSAHNEAMLAGAHARLDNLVLQGELGSLSGFIAIEVAMEHGRILSCQYEIKGIDTSPAGSQRLVESS